MKINIHTISDSEDETIDIFCHEGHKERMRSIARELAKDSPKITCKKDDKTYQIRLDEIF